MKTLTEINGNYEILSAERPKTLFEMFECLNQIRGNNSEIRDLTSKQKLEISNFLKV